MRGRKIYQKQSFAKGGSIDENVSLGAESGMYFIEVDGEKSKGVKKLIVE